MLAMAPERCPCCGTVLAIAQETTWHRSLNLVETPYGSAILTASKARIFDSLWLARPHGLTNFQLIEKTWRGVDGGPTYADGAIRVHCSKLRIVLQPLGIILTHGRAGYMLVVSTPEQAAAAYKHIRQRIVRGSTE